MEPKPDSELRDLLREWKAPDVSPLLEARVLAARRAWWDPLLRGYIRVPVPLACCLLLLILAGAWRLWNPPVAPCSAAEKKLTCLFDSTC